MGTDTNPPERLRYLLRPARAGDNVVIVRQEKRDGQWDLTDHVVSKPKPYDEAVPEFQRLVEENYTKEHGEAPWWHH